MDEKKGWVERKGHQDEYIMRTLHIHKYMHISEDKHLQRQDENEDLEMGMDMLKFFSLINALLILIF